MKVLSSYQEGRLTLYLKGELDHHEAAAVLGKISRTMDDYLPRDCVVDMEGLTFMDSSGIALIEDRPAHGRDRGPCLGGERQKSAFKSH